jgi:hypothetical protein
MNNKYLIPASIALAAVIVSGTWIYISRLENDPARRAARELEEQIALESAVLPKDGIELPVTWGGLGKELTEAGVIDLASFEKVSGDRGGMTPGVKAMLEGSSTGKIRITRENAQDILNILWALGLGNKNEILEKGEMMDSRYGGAGNFASTGGWTLARGNAMNHYSTHRFMTLDAAAQAKVDAVSRTIYRPCCGNSAHFPDCNHGMAMLGLMELMASQGASEKEMYQAALAVNRYWFADTYLDIAAYLAAQGIDWQKVEPQALLAADYASAAGYQKVRAAVRPVKEESGGSCGV